MKASELRLGNLVYLKSKDKVYEISSGHDIEEIDDAPQNFDAEPIPLTEEWLLKFGFKKNDNNQFILMEGSVDILFNKDLNGWTCDGINFSINMTEYVHQLQNLYFALTGEELTILS